MIYENIVEGIFCFRPNRFIAECLVDGEKVTVHVKNTGRCRELLIPGVTVFLQYSDKESRKTKYSLISVMKGDILINIDSQIPNVVLNEALVKEKIALPGLKSPVSLIKREAAYQSSRFDFYIEAGDQKAFIEVKGVTLEEGGIALFPDAPTERGVKHLLELCKALDEGYLSYMIFIIQMKGISYFIPNEKMHARFAETLKEAASKGVHVLAYDCLITKESIEMDKEVKIKLEMDI